MFRSNWWKILCAGLLFYAVIAGFLVPIPEKPVIGESLRNLFFHVGMWFAMLSMLITGFAYSIRYLATFEEVHDMYAEEAIRNGLIFGALGIVTGMIWGNFTWGTPWARDPKLNGAAAGLLIYLAYLILRGSVGDINKKAKVAAVYNILAFFLWIVFVLILPRVSGDSIHPGTKGDEVTILPQHLESNVRIVFYPAMVGWILLSLWILQIRIKIREINLLLDK